MNRFVIELPKFKYNKQDLFEFQESITDWQPNLHYAKKGINSSDSDFFDYYIRDTSHPVLSEIVNQLNFTPSDKDFKFSKILKNGVLPFHIDPYRSSILMIPISDNPSEIEWKFNNKIAYTHKYTCPTIINGTVKHGVPKTDNDRIFLQIKISAGWKDLLNNLELFFKF